MNPGGWGYLFPLTVGAGRLLANKHHASDVFAGFGIGEVLRLIPCG
jgi:membrane-associated phospholipid phosphatase